MEKVYDGLELKKIDFAEAACSTCISFTDTCGVEPCVGSASEKCDLSCGGFTSSVQ